MVKYVFGPYILRDFENNPYIFPPLVQFVPAIRAMLMKRKAS